MARPRAVLVKCWRKKPDLTKLEASRGDEGMVSIDKYLDKFVCRGEEKIGRWQRRIKEQGGSFSFCLNWRNLKDLKANGHYS